MLRLVVTSLSAVDLALMFSAEEDVCPKVSEEGTACNVLDVMCISFDVTSNGRTFVVCKDLLSFKAKDESVMSTEK